MMDIDCGPIIKGVISIEETGEDILTNGSPVFQQIHDGAEEKAGGVVLKTPEHVEACEHCLASQ